MSQIPLHHNTAAGGSALSAIGGPSSGTRKDNGRAGSTTSTTASSSPASFSQLLNQSAQHLQARAPAPQAQTFASAPPAAQPAAKPATPARTPSQTTSAQGGSRSGNGTSSAAQEENKLNARNAANRSAANRQADAAPKPQARQTQAKPDSAEPAQARSDKGPAKAADSGDKAGKTDASDAATAQDDATSATNKTAATDPTAAAQQMLAMLRGDAPQEARPQLKDGALTDAAGDGHAALAGHGKGGHAAAGVASHEALQKDLQQATLSALDGKTRAGEGAEGLEALAGGSREIRLGDKTTAGGPAQSFDALLAAAQQADASGGTSGTDAAAPADGPSVPLSQPLDSPDFAPELSASVSMLIQDGVHEAQLQLNPADMGPVAIQIQLDGQQAQVNFHAEQAATRDVLMRSMPDLAAALQSQGLTLSGGGVFAQAQSGNGQSGRGSDGDGSGRRGSRGGSSGDDGLTAVARSERRTQPRGLVDLYA
ncbi:flagellar hook-length control protein FliK [Roseateles sp. SL47]|uniref:flagellar hook-length control protein FliK n=1 Tax=Roseateles sp. SL47 TaxID=2995138 RepID=UPI00226D8452|nr:flagellar hook-length control protein FliK [Roseateles sp. SL47]WAC72553.1 flagellar hook-length control protein FliK [Roseateles sp. SL47]